MTEAARTLRRGLQPDLAELAVDFADTVIALKRVARRVVFANLDPGLPSSESELLALVGRSKGIRINEAAEILQVAPNTVSTLVSTLARAGLLRRSQDPNDRRAVLLQLTVSGAARLRHIRRRRREVLTGAMAALSDADRDVLAEALPAMHELLNELVRLDPSKGA